MELSNKDIKKLKKLAHDLKPVVFLGQKGITDSLIKATEEALNDHELIKVRFVDFKEAKKDIIAEIIEKTASHLISIIGNIAIIYKPQENPEKKVIVL